MELGLALVTAGFVVLLFAAYELVGTNLSEEHSQAGAAGRHRMMLEAYGYRWFRVGGLDYLLKRSDIEKQPRRKK